MLQELSGIHHLLVSLLLGNFFPLRAHICGSSVDCQNLSTGETCAYIAASTVTPSNGDTVNPVSHAQSEHAYSFSAT